jgi:hypothetical protein
LWEYNLQKEEKENLQQMCPLCHAVDVRDYHTDKHRHYLQCGTCCLVFVPHEFHLSLDEEKAVYDQHENNPSDLRYRTFLSRLANPLLSRLERESTGLDFGSGPGPTLSVMLSEQGHNMYIYDPFYARDETVLNDKYDFITATEVVEHLRFPGRELQRLWSLIHPEGYLALMTKMVVDNVSFSNWHYKNDNTHICFFSRESFTLLALEWGTNAEFIGTDVILFQKPALLRSIEI